MKAYELLYINRNTLRIMSEMSLDASDIKYLEMYKDYTRLTAEGHKKAYIMQYLADEYSISERTIYRVIDRLSVDVSFNKGKIILPLIFLLTKRVSAIMF